MKKQLVYKSTFLKAYDKLPDGKRQAVIDAVGSLCAGLATGRFAAGLGVKHLAGQIYEFRVDLNLRGVYLVTGTQVILALLGNHDDVRRYLKNS